MFQQGVFFNPIFFSNIQTQDVIIQISPPSTLPTLITFGVVTLAIALVSLITLTLAAAVTLATLTRPRGLVSGRSIRGRHSWAQHHRNLRVERNRGDSHGKTPQNPNAPRGPCLVCLCGPTGFTSLRTHLGTSLPTQAWRPGAGPILGFQTNVTGIFC